MIRDIYVIPDNLYQEAYDYSRASCAFTSNRHDFHSGGLNNKQQKMFEGKLGEKAFKMMLIDNEFFLRSLLRLHQIKRRWHSKYAGVFYFSFLKTKIY